MGGGEDYFLVWFVFGNYCVGVGKEEFVLGGWVVVEVKLVVNDGLKIWYGWDFFVFVCVCWVLIIIGWCIFCRVGIE